MPRGNRVARATYAPQVKSLAATVLVSPAEQQGKAAAQTGFATTRVSAAATGRASSVAVLVSLVAQAERARIPDTSAQIATSASNVAGPASRRARSTPAPTEVAPIRTGPRVWPQARRVLGLRVPVVMELAAESAAGLGCLVVTTGSNALRHRPSATTALVSSAEARVSLAALEHP